MPLEDDNPFELDPSRPGFEGLSESNGFVFWWASDLARMLGYDDFRTFLKALQRAMTVCVGLDVSLMDNFVATHRHVEGRVIEDFKLSRFACYLTANNGDVRKPAVAKAQAYFVMYAEQLRLLLVEADGVERVALRGDITDGEKSLASTATKAGVTDFALFQNAGYRGLYNLSINQLKDRKGVPRDRTALDFMGKRELAANLFRVQETQERIKSTGVRGQAPLEQTAHQVGREVRGIMTRDGGVAPESLKPAKDLREVKKTIKGTHRGFKKLDKPTPRTLQLEPPKPKK